MGEMRAQLTAMVLLIGCADGQGVPEEHDARTPSRERLQFTGSVPDSAQTRDGATADAGAAHDAEPGEPPDAAFALDDSGALADARAQPAPGRVGAPCAQDADCADLGDGHHCLKQRPVGSDSGYCTRDCDGATLDTAQCGEQALCVTFNDQTQCHRVCASDSDCRTDDGYLCAHILLGLCLQP